VERNAAIDALFHLEKAIGSHAGVLSPSAAAAVRGVMRDPDALMQYVRASENKPDTAAALIMASATAGDTSDEASGRSSGGAATRARSTSARSTPRLEARRTGDGSGSDTSSDVDPVATPEMLAEITGLDLDEAMVLLEASGGDLSAAVTLHLENAEVRAPSHLSAGRNCLSLPPPFTYHERTSFPPPY
jgi:hypothetical protein